MTDTQTLPPPVNVFGDFLDEEVFIIGQFAQNMAAKADDVVFTQDSHERALYVVIEGRLAVQIRTADGDALTVGTIEAGDVFGELSFLDGHVRTATIVCLEDAQLLRLPRQGFDQLQADYPSIAAKLMSDLALVVSLRLRAADQLIARLSARA